MKKQVKNIELLAINPTIVTVEIEGDSDLVLNKMDDVTARELTDIRNDKAKKNEPVNEWEKIITKIHWRDGKPKEFSEESMIDALKNNAPCITSFGLKKSFGQAVVRNGIDKYATKFDAGFNILGNGLIPISFSEHYIDEMLMQPQRGKPVLVQVNRFAGWRAKFKISCLENVYGLEQVINIIKMAGFGLGIGSSRPSGFGRYHVSGVK